MILITGRFVSVNKGRNGTVILCIGVGAVRCQARIVVNYDGRTAISTIGRQFNKREGHIRSILHSIRLQVIYHALSGGVRSTIFVNYHGLRVLQVSVGDRELIYGLFRKVLGDLYVSTRASIQFTFGGVR